ncbi:MAG: sodium/glutamate symporter [Planctomycetaceae bacterium]
MLIDFSLMSVLLVSMHLLRGRVRLFQRLLLPTPILAGLVGLACSSQAWDLLPWQQKGEGGLALDDYPAQLVMVLFATLYLGWRPRQPAVGSIMQNAGDTLFYNLSILIGMYGLALAIGPLMLKPLMSDRLAEFSLLLPAGFAGGHGSVTAIGGTLEKLGWNEASSLGFTFATIGLMIGIVGGLLLINIGTRCGWTRCMDTVSALSDDVRSGFIDEPNQRSIGRETVSPIALEPLTWHLAIVLSAVAATLLIEHFAKQYLPERVFLPKFAVAMLMGALLQISLNCLGVGKYIDRHLIGRIGSSASDFLIAFGIVSIKISIVVEYLLPILIMSAFGLIFCLVYFWCIGRRIFRNFWFERSLFVFGWTTGVVATSIMLLRVVDPRFRSRTLEDFGLAYLLIGPVEISLILFLPPIAAGQAVMIPALALVTVAVLCIVFSRVVFGWYPYAANETRPGEAAMLDAD